jgi:hypothetical protein
MANNVSNASDNSAYTTWVLFKKGWTRTGEEELAELLSFAAEKFYEAPQEFISAFRDRLPQYAHPPIEFKGLNCIFFTYFIRRLPIMLSGTKLTWHSPKSPCKKEVAVICEACIDSFVQRHKGLPVSEYIASWREGYQEAFRLTGFLVSEESRDEFYYDATIIENFLDECLEALMALRFPDFILAKSPNKRREYETQIHQAQQVRQFLISYCHVFIDRLAEHLVMAYPIFTAF